jgi:hypothetical protein
MRAIVKPLGKRPSLQTAIVGGRVLVLYDSVLQALGIDPEKEPADRPKTVTINRTIELTGLSPRTVGRMIATGRAERAKEHAA